MNNDNNALPAARPLFIFSLSAIAVIIYTASFLFCGIILRSVLALLPCACEFACAYSLLSAKKKADGKTAIKALLCTFAFAAVCIVVPVFAAHYIIILGSAFCAGLQAFFMLVFLAVTAVKLVRLMKKENSDGLRSAKQIAALCIISAFLLSGALCSYAYIEKPGFGASSFLGMDINMTAHRGYSKKAPENTKESAIAAGEAGFYGCEFDIRLTSDKVPVVMHDKSVDRMTDGTGSIEGMTAAEIAALRIDAGHNISEYKDKITVPTLSDMLDICEKYNMVPVIEIKGGGTECADILLGILNERGITEKCTVIDFDENDLIYIRSKSDTVKLMLLVNDVTDKTVELCEKYSFTLSFNASLAPLFRELRTAKDKGIPLAAWTVDNRESLYALKKLGTAVVTSNCITP